MKKILGEFKEFIARGNVIDFLIVAFCIFMFVKFVNAITHKTKKQEEKKEAPKKNDEVILLEEIRDLLKNNKKKD